MNASLLKYFLAEKRISVSKLAEMTGLSVTALSRKMNGKTSFRREEISAIVNLLNLDYETMMKIFFEDVLS